MKEKEILIIIPARGGSEGIPLKNLSMVGGKSLIALVGAVVRELPITYRAIVSTDHEAIADEAIRVGLEVPFLRPPKLSGSRVSDVDVLTHALREVESATQTYEVIVMLQPTSPLRKPQHVIDTINMLISGVYDSVLTLSETDSKAHPLKQLRLRGEIVQHYDNLGEAIVARQQLEQLFHRNGAAYALTRECLLQQETVIGKNCGSIVIREPIVNIDTEFDLALADWLFKRSKGNMNY